MTFRNLWVCLLGMLLPMAASAETATFLFSGRANFWDGTMYQHITPESFVISTSDPEQIATMRQFLSRREQGLEPRPMVASFRVVLGADSVNRNYAAPGAPAWNWHVESLSSVTRVTWDGITTDWIPPRDASPSDVPKLFGEWIYPVPPIPTEPINPPPAPPSSVLCNFIYYPLQMELRADTQARFTILSQRAYVSSGDRVMIGGFAIEGGTPRNIIVRVLGPSLAAYGVGDVLADPSFEIYSQGKRIASNDTWESANLNGATTKGSTPAIRLSPLVPNSLLEPALRLSLAPGAYTVIVRGTGSSSGVALLEVYGLD